MFERARRYGKAWVEGTKQAFDPERLQTDLSAAVQQAYLMPAATPSSIAFDPALAARPPVAAAEAASQRATVVQSLVPPTGAPVVIERIITATPFPHEAMLAVHLAGLDASLVYGLFPSTELLWPATLGSPGPGAAWEWIVVHAGSAGQVERSSADRAAGAPVDAAGLTAVCTELSRERRWIDRPTTAPLLHDEEVAAAVAGRVGLDPARCLGLARLLVWGQFGPGAPGLGGDTDVGLQPGGAPAASGGWDERLARWSGRPETSRMVTVEPVGVRLLWQVGPGEQAPPLPAYAPVPVPPDHALPAQVALLDWAPMSRAVQPVWTDPPADPTTFPHLPASPLELLATYLRIVGVRPEDCFGVSVTVAGQQSGFFTQRGLSSPRGDAASLITAVHRDRPEHVEGRLRFEQFRTQVLQVPLGVERPTVGRFERMAYAGMKTYVRHQVGADLYEELGGDDMYDTTNYPYLAGPPPSAPGRA